MSNKFGIERFICMSSFLQLNGRRKQVVLIGNGRSYLSALITGKVKREDVESALEKVNAQLPHYKRIHSFHIAAEPFTIENGLLTANGKLKRDLIAARYKSEIEEMYRKAS